jgi:HEAT repeat protein
MPAQRRLLRIFLASPGDVVAERELALGVLDGLAYDPLLRDRVTIDNVAWDKRGAGAPMLAGITPQASIAAGLPRPSECDIVVVLFWSRMGTPLPDEYRKTDGSRYESGTEWEYEDGVTAFRATGKPYVLLYRRTQQVLLDPDDAKFGERVAQYGKVRAFFDGLRSADGSARDGYGTYELPSDFRAQLEHDLKALIARILEKEPALSNAPAEPVAEVWRGSPFPGLRPFAAADATIFFGRVREVDELIARVTSHSFVAVVGASGSGKSSVVAAGVVPRLQLTAGASGEPRWIPVQITPDQLGVNDPFASAAAAILAAFPASRQKKLGTLLREHPERLAQLLADATPAGEPVRVLLFVDQFEELFTTIPPTLREAFVELLRVASQDERVRIIITIRADFYGRCVEHPVLARLMESTTFPLSAAGVGALAEMIAKPAARAGLTFEDALAQRILDDTGDEPGALALMAYTLDELYRATGGDGRLTHAAYDEIGGVQGAIGKRSETVFLALSDEEKAALPRVFRELVKVDDQGNATRQRARLSCTVETEEARRLTDALTDARLLVQSRGEKNEPVVEVAHEALFRSWSRLAEWIKETQDELRLLQQVRVAAAEWDMNGRRDDYLWSHERLAPVYQLREHLGIEFEPVLAGFIRPEFDRLVEEIKSDRRFFRQRPHIERLIQIGTPAAASMIECLKFATTRSARAALFSGLATVGAGAVSHLLKASRSRTAGLRRIAAEAFILVRSPEVLAALPRLMQDKDALVREKAARAAAHSRDPALIPNLIVMTRDRFRRVRFTAAVAVGTFTDDSAVDALVCCLRDTDEEVRRTAFDIVAQLASRDPAQALHIFDRRSNSDFTLLRHLVQANTGAIRSSPRAHDVMHALAALLDDADPTIKRQAARALLAFDERDATDLVVTALEQGGDATLPLVQALEMTMSPESVRAIARLLQSSTDDVRAKAIRAIGSVADSIDRMPDTRTSAARNALTTYIGVPAMLALAEESNPVLRRSILSVLSAVKAKEGATIYIRFLRDRDGEVRRRAAQALGSIGEREAVPALLEVLRDTYVPAAEAAARSLALLDAGRAASPLAIRIFRKIADNEQMELLASLLVPLLEATPEGIEMLKRTEVRGGLRLLSTIAEALHRHREATANA